MRDQQAPMINGHDFSGIVNRYSFQCEQYYEEGGNGGTFLDGSTVKDVLAVKERLSWTCNSMTAAQYKALTAALNAGTTPDLSIVIFKDPALNAIRKAGFHVVTRPPFLFSCEKKEAPYYCTKAGAALVMEESYPIEWYAFTPPTETNYYIGDTFAFASAGMSVTKYDVDNVATDITSQCAAVPEDGSTATTAGDVRVSVSYEGVEIGAFHVAVEGDIIASGDWWTLFGNGHLRVFCAGEMPEPDLNPPWFAWSASIKTVDISGAVTSVSTSAFSGCSSLTNVAIPDSVISIGDNAFSGCSSLAGVTIPESVTTIGNYAFYGCTGLTSVTIPGNVASMGNGVFRDCTGLTSVTVSNGVTDIPGTFYGCVALTDVTISGSVTNMFHAFDGCTALTNVTIPGNATNLQGAFNGCTALTGAAIPGSVTDMTDAFSGCTSLASVTISEGVTVINGYAFSGCSGLSGVTIPSGVTSIEQAAFMDCSNLASITIPHSMSSVGYRATYNCSALTDIYFDGTIAQWNAIRIGDGNTPLINATVHYTTPI